MRVFGISCTKMEYIYIYPVFQSNPWLGTSNVVWGVFFFLSLSSFLYFFASLGVCFVLFFPLLEAYIYVFFVRGWWMMGEDMVLGTVRREGCE